MAYTTINKFTDYFNNVLYVGNGTAIASGGKTVTGVGFQPDFVWGKARSGTDAVDNHELTDAVRGVTKYLKCNNNSAETTSAESLTSFTNDGFILGNNGQMNRNGNNCVAWNWKANGAGSTNNDGNRTSTVSASTTAGFSIVRYQGNNSNNQTIGHGLGVAPKMIFIKDLSSSLDWIVYNKTITASKHLHLNENAAEATDAGMFNNTEPTSSVFTVHANNDVNKANDYFIAYCFAEKTGYSKIDSYTGNGNADGTFVYTGFKPAFVMIKRTNDANDWFLQDNKRLGYNAANYYLEANTNLAEQSNSDIDILSNGFKCRSNGGGHNSSGGNYIYMAIAEAPLVGSNNVPCTAR